MLLNKAQGQAALLSPSGGKAPLLTPTPLNKRASCVVKAAPQMDVDVEWPSGNKTFKTESGDNARLALLDEKADLYGLWGKVMNCGGGGNCGTCIVEVAEGMELLNPKTPAEQKKLKNKPDTWRLGCQTTIGDGSNSGRVKLRTQPKN